MSRIIFQKSYLILLPSYQMTHPHKHPFLHLFFSKKDAGSVSMTQRCKSVPSCVYLPKTNRHCYIVDDTVLFSGDCLAVNEQGGYRFLTFSPNFRT